MAGSPKPGPRSQYYSFIGLGGQHSTPRSHSGKSRVTQDRLSTNISPPTLKRKRSTSGLFSDVSERPSSAHLSTDSNLDTSRTPLRLFGSNGKSFVEQARHEGRVEPLRRSSSFLGSSLFREYISRDSSASGRGSDGTHSGSSSRRGSFSKRACRTCEKSSSTNYNPMISCLGCERPYHDSCRKPPLIDGVDPQRWRCSKCLGGSQRRKGSKLERSRVLKPPVNSLSAHNPILNNPLESVSQAPDETSSARLSVRKPLHDTGHIVSITNIEHISPDTGPDIALMDEIIPLSNYSSKEIVLVGPKITSLEHNTNFISLPPGEETPSINTSTHWKQYSCVAENGTSSVKCPDHHNRTGSIENRKLVTPETPDSRRSQLSSDRRGSNISLMPRSLVTSKGTQSVRAIKSAPTTKYAGIPRAVFNQKSAPVPPPLDRVVDNVDANYMPFERTRARKPPRLFGCDIDKQVDSFYEITPRDHTPLIETMTDAEKAQKITAIKARRSRKAFFGRDHRLAHVRRYQRLDIHDERDGMWKPAYRTSGTDNSDRAMKDRDGSETLREAFGLPKNVVPVNDGQTELAFRVGAPANGRLPRSRVIYKVGKLFGGELTVRTS